MHTESSIEDKESLFQKGLLYAQGKGVEQSYQLASNYYKLAAECFINGIGTTKSIESALNYYQLAAREGYTCRLSSIGRHLSDEGIKRKVIASFLKSIISQNVDLRADQLYSLAQLFEQGHDLLYSPNAAVHFYTLSSGLGNTHAQKRLGNVYAEGLLGVEKNEELALHYYFLSGSLTKATQLAAKHIETSPNLAFEYYQRIFQVNKRIAASKLGYCYKQGIGVQASLEKAIEYYKISCEHGPSINYFHLGNCFEQIGDEESLKQAIYYYQEGAQKNSYQCYFRLGQLYEKGKGVPQSFEKALEYYSIAAENRLAEACKHLFYEYHFGRSVEQSYDKALRYLKILVYQKDPIFQYNLGIYYENGFGGLDASDEKAFHYYKLAADQGFAKAQWKVAEDHRKGVGTQQSSEEAIKYFQLAAENGHIKSCEHLFYEYHFGESVEQSYENALHYLQILANQKIPTFQYYLGVYYQTGFGVLDVSDDKAFLYYKLAADQGHAIAQYNTGLYYTIGFDGLDPSNEQAFHYYKLAADQGHAKAQCKVAEHYKKGIGTEQSPEKAIKYRQLAGENGHVRSCEYLFYEYHFGKTVEQSYEKALHYLQILANQEIPIFQYNLGIYYKNGRGGLDPSDEKAFHYYKLAADQGYAISQHVLGNCLISGQGAPQSLEEALKFYKLASEQGLAKSSKALFNHYSIFSKDEVSVKEAVKYLQLGAQQGEPELQRILGFYYENGIEIEKSPEEAFKYYKLSADQGDSKALYRLALCYDQGIGVECSNETALHYYQMAAEKGSVESFVKMADHYFKFDKSKAYEYYKLAADHGHEDSQYLLAKCYESGGHYIKENPEKALLYHRLAAQNGHIESIRLLYKWYYYGINVKESQEEALKYLQLGVQLNDAECQYQLGNFYELGRGNLAPSIVEAWKYHQLAANQGHWSANIVLKKRHRLLHPNALKVDITPYLKDQLLSTLENILKNYGNHPIYLEMPYFTWEEAQIICDAMIDNPRFTFMCLEQEIARLFLAFELRGFEEKKTLMHYDVINPSTQQETYGCVFIAYDISDSSLKYEEDNPQIFEEKYLEESTDLPRKKNLERAHKIYATLPKNEITYPGSEELDITPYLEDKKLETLRKILENSKDRPIYLILSEASYDEMDVIRDAMIANPRFTFFCLRPNSFSLLDAFHSAGYNPHRVLKKKGAKFSERKFIGFVFKGG